MIKLIVAIGKKNLIGKDNQLPWRIPEELAFFKKTTYGSTLLMGGNTFLGLPKKLTGRKIIVFSKEKIKNAYKNINSLDSLKKELKKYKGNKKNLLFISGGKWIYENLYYYADELIISKIKGKHKGNVYLNWDLSNYQESLLEEHEDFDVYVYKKKRNFLKKIYEMQRKLDYKIHSSIPKKDPLIIRSNKIMSLLVETSELANEIQFFKYWKKNRVLKKSKVLEEFIDGIHFYTSLCLDLNILPPFKPKVISEKMHLQFEAIYESQTLLFKKFNKTNLIKSFMLYLGLTKLLKFSKEDVFNGYCAKNKINHKRIKENY